MNTPVWDSVRRYAESGAARFHMPGHKGAGEPEKWDLTEIAGADSLWEASGILLESEKNAARLFGAGATFYGTEGASLSIRAAASLLAAFRPGKPILALRNVHRSFASFCAALEIPVRYITPPGATLFGCKLEAPDLRRELADGDFAGVFLTSPDYAGRRQDIAALAAVCREAGVPLAVDNAHGAYLAFLEPDTHPIALGADLSCDSAHKTLPVLTGGAYLHVSPHAPAFFKENARRFLSLFATTSPSYLTLASLDRCNARLATSFREEARRCAEETARLKERLSAFGFDLGGSEPFKITLLPKSRGYTGAALAAILRENGLEPEFADPDALVLMLSPDSPSEDGERLLRCLSALPLRRAKFPAAPELPEVTPPAMPPKEALFAPAEEIPVENALGRILAAPSVSCPPAIPIAFCGERLTAEHLAVFAYYGVSRVTVVK